MDLAAKPTASSQRPGERRTLAAGVAIGVFAIGAVILGHAAGLDPRGAAPWVLGALLAIVVAAALGAVLAVARARTRERLYAVDEGRRELAETLAAQGMLILRLNADGDILQHFGTPFEPICPQMLAGSLWALCDQPGPLRSALDRAMADGRSELAFVPIGKADGWISAVMTARENSLIAVLRDDSAEQGRLNALEEAAREARDHDAGKSRFIANMSHELRTPLNAVIGFSDIMRSRMFGPLNEKYAEYAALIHESGRHLLDLINDLLDMSKIEAHRYELSREVFDARDAVSGALRLVRDQAETAGITLKGDIADAPLKVIADERALKQIVLNLVANALKFTPAGGVITVLLSGEGETLALTVADTGIGIAEDDLARLGRPYEQAGGADQKALGAGLGLSLVRAFAELHGGSLSIQSTLGQGATVDVLLPVLLPAQEPSVALGQNVVALHPRR